VSRSHIRRKKMKKMVVVARSREKIRVPWKGAVLEEDER